MRGLYLGACFSVCCVATAVVLADARSDLQKRGIRVNGSSANVISESDLASRMKDVATLRRKLNQANSQYADHRKADEKLTAQITQLNQQLVALNAQLANVTDVATNNRLIGAIGAVEGQLRLAYENRQQREKQESILHEQISAARDGYITHVTAMRKSADDVGRLYYNADPEVQSLISQLNESASPPVVLQPSSVFLANLRKLDDLQGEILAEDIKLKREGNTYWATVKCNGENSLNMVVDSGASTVLLSSNDAAKIGLRPGDKDPLVRLGVADGRSTIGRLMTIRSMQLGQFTIENVECVVLNPEAGNAEPLLGMTFLGRFKFQLDGGKSTLSLTKIKDSATTDRLVRGPGVPPYQLLRSDWEFVPVAPGTAFYSDRPFKITRIPDELKSAVLVRRKLNDPQWLSGEIVVNQPVDLFVAVRSNWVARKKPTKDLDETDLTRLTDEGWKQLDGFAAGALPEEKWTWVLLRKRFEPGPVNVPALIPREASRALFFMKPVGA